MTFEEDLFEELEGLLNPQSIAIVGLPRGNRVEKLFLHALIEMGFSGPIYPVNPKASIIEGIRCYPRLSDIKASVDLAIVLVGQHSVLRVVEECAQKGVKAVVIYTAGYKETGTETGRKFEEDIATIARGSGIRLIGPNCMGIYAPKAGLSFFPGLPKKAGHIGLISQSGSLANIIIRGAKDRGLAFSKAVSLGNEADLQFADFLSYFSKDPETKIITGYIESVKDGPYFMNALKKAVSAKPVILYKIGNTEEGRRAAYSHTGALTVPEKIWDGIINQCGSIQVIDWDECVDTIMAFYLLPSSTGKRVAIISEEGVMAVAAAEAADKNGLEMAYFTQKTRSHLAKYISSVGTSATNPVNVSVESHKKSKTLNDIVSIVAADSNVDAVIGISSGLNESIGNEYIDALIEAYRRSGKPFLFVGMLGISSETRNTFCQAGIPYFNTPEKALTAYAKFTDYYIRFKHLA